MEQKQIKTKLIILNKAKYIKRWKGKDGKWNYLYRQPETKRPAAEEPTIDEPVRTAAETLAREVATAERLCLTLFDNKKEVGISLTADGKVITTAVGSGSMITYTPEQIAQIHGAAVSIHNHPSGNSFSMPDVMFALIHDVKDMRVVGDDIAYSYKKPEDYEFPTDPKIQAMELRSIEILWETTRQMYISDIKRELDSGILNESEANRKISHTIMSQFAKEFGGTYIREDREMVKAKYIKRWRGKDGEYRYEYPTEKKVRTSTPYAKAEKEAQDFVFNKYANKTEVSRSIGADGSIVNTTYGDSESIRISKDDMAQLYGCRLNVHNHPMDYTFSTPDILFGITARIEEIQVVTATKVHSYKPDFDRIDKLTGGNAAGFADRVVKKIDEIEMKLQTGLKFELQSKMEKKELTMAEAGAIYQEKIMQGMLSFLGGEYITKPRKGNLKKGLEFEGEDTRLVAMEKEAETG